MLSGPNLVPQYFVHGHLRLAYYDYAPVLPSDQSPVLLLHGFTSCAQHDWLQTGWVDALLNMGRRVLLLDARGHGHSSKSHDSQDYPASVMQSDIAELLQHLELSQVDLLGFSMGARVATFVALKHPQLIRRLVIAGMGDQLIRGIGNAEAIAKNLLAPNISKIDDRMARRFRRLAELQNNDLHALAACIVSTRTQIQAEDLQTINHPTLVIAGARDEIAGSAAQLAQHFPNAQAHQQANCHHFNALMNEDFRAAALQFIAQ